MKLKCEDYIHEEIAERMGVSRPRVTKLLQETPEKARKVLDGVTLYAPDSVVYSE
jgi:DNA-directed RNA polymerase specialized sigma24 family protein